MLPQSQSSRTIATANAAREARNFTRAEAVLRAHLQTQPDDAGVLALLGVVLGQTRRGPQGIFALERAWKLRPGDPEIASLFGSILLTVAQPQRAIDLLNQVPEGHASYTNAQFNIAAAKVRLEAFEEAEVILRRLLALPSAACSMPRPLVAASLAGVLPKLLRSSEARELLRATLRQHPGDLLLLCVLAPMCVYADDITPHALDSLHIAAGRRLADTQQALPPLTPARNAPLAPFSSDDRKLRIGFISADFRDHVVMRFWLPLIEHLNSDRVEAVAFSYAANEDAVTQSCESAIARLAPPSSGEVQRGWLSIKGMNDADASRAIYQQRVDILIEMSGFTQDTRIQLLCRRLAPLQLSAFGYAHRACVPGIDGRLGDYVSDPPAGLDHNPSRSSAPHTSSLSAATATPIEPLTEPGARQDRDHLRSESSGCDADEKVTEVDTGDAGDFVVRVAPCFLCYQPPQDLPAPERIGLGNSLRLGCFNNVAKWSPTCISLWQRVLERLPGARLVLKSAGIKPGERTRLLLSRLAHYGLDVERVELLPHASTRAEHLASYNLIDIAMDTFPYHGTTTTCEALVMGVPVVTLKGDRHASRVGASLLAAAGFPQWVAAVPDEYVAIAGGLGDTITSGSMKPKAQVQSQVLSSALCDAKSYAAAWEVAMRAAVQRAYSKRLASAPGASAAGPATSPLRDGGRSL